MSFNDLLTDTVSILKKNGNRKEGISASVQKNKIFIFGSQYLIETGDLIFRKMSNGGEETYEVIDPGFCERVGGIEAHYQMDVKKLGLPEAEKAVKTITININGNNARINQNSIDNSTNIVNVNPDVLAHIDSLRSEINRLNLSLEQKKSAEEIIEAIKNQFESGKPSKSVVQTLLSGLPHISSIASIGSFLISCITI